MFDCQPSKKVRVCPSVSSCVTLFSSVIVLQIFCFNANTMFRDNVVLKNSTGSSNLLHFLNDFLNDFVFIFSMLVICILCAG